MSSQKDHFLRSVKNEMKEFETSEEKRSRERDAKALAMALLAEDETLTHEQRQACREWSDNAGRPKNLLQSDSDFGADDAGGLGGGAGFTVSSAVSAT